MALAPHFPSAHSLHECFDHLSVEDMLDGACFLEPSVPAYTPTSYEYFLIGKSGCVMQHSWAEVVSGLHGTDRLRASQGYHLEQIECQSAIEHYRIATANGR